MALTAQFMEAGHNITVSSLGPMWVTECTCGLSRRFLGKRVANTFGEQHHHDTTGCTCTDHHALLVGLIQWEAKA